jgi:hypothetical protein
MENESVTWTILEEEEEQWSQWDEKDMMKKMMAGK